MNIYMRFAIRYNQVNCVCMQIIISFVKHCKNLISSLFQHDCRYILDVRKFSIGKKNAMMSLTSSPDVLLFHFHHSDFHQLFRQNKTFNTSFTLPAVPTSFHQKAKSKIRNKKYQKKKGEREMSF